MSETPDDHFDLDAWLASVTGETIRFEEPTGLGARETGFRPRAPALCGNCEEMVMLVEGDREIPTQCPVCEREIGMLELGTESIAQWQSYDDDVKPV